MTRAFLALEVPAAVKERLAAAQENLQRELPRARWTRPDGWHLTLKFLGEVAAPALDGLAADAVSALSTDGVRLMETGNGAAVLEGLSVEVDDLFTAGDRAAAAVTLRGTYAGGLPGVPAEAVGLEGRMQATLMARVADGAVTELEMVRDRWGLVRRLRKALAAG